MSIQTQIERLQDAKSSIKSAISEKGVTVPDSASLNDYAEYVSQISVGASSSIIDSGKCGESVDWTLYDNGELIISGSGAMTNYSATSSVFYSNTAITNVTIETGVTSIGDYAFRSCGNLTSITIPDSVTAIGTAAFIYCKSLTSVTMPNSVTSIQPSAFSNCSGLENITIPSGISTIATSVFDYCTGLANVTIPNSVTRISLSAFDHCTRLGYVFYIGTKAEWDKITISTGNDNLKNATLYCEYEDSSNAETVDGWHFAVKKGSTPDSTTEPTITLLYTVG